MSQSFLYRRLRSGIWARSFTYLDNLHQRERKVFQREAKHGRTQVRKALCNSQRKKLSRLMPFFKQVASLFTDTQYKTCSASVAMSRFPKAKSHQLEKKINQRLIYILLVNTKLHSHHIRRCVKSRQGCGRSLELMHCVADFKWFSRFFFIHLDRYKSLYWISSQ